MKQFNVVTSNLDGGTILSFSGDLDACSSVVAERAMAAALNAATKHIFVDLQNLSYISSAGLGRLLDNLQASRQQNKVLIFYGLSPKIRNVFELAGLQKVFLLADSLEDAIMLSVEQNT